MKNKASDLVSLGLINLAIVTAISASGVGLYIFERAHIPQWISFTVLLVVLNILWMVRFKRRLLKLTDRPATLWIADPVEFPQLDRQTFDDYDMQLIELGFEPRFCFGSEPSSAMKSLARAYYHPIYKCGATNGQVFHQGAVIMSTIFITSQLDDNWWLSVCNVEPSAVSCLWRRPRALWQAIPGVGPRELLNAHLKVRQRMMDGLGIGNVTKDRDQHAHFEHVAEGQQQQREVLRRKNAILLYLEYLLYNRRPVCSWMGDLERTIRERQSS